MDTCTFCANPADSDEHLIPRWILKKFPLPYPMVHRIGDGPTETRDTPELKLPCACETCNNRWMSGLETTCKKFMGPMIEDVAISLDRQYRQNLSEWAVKTAMCLDSVHSFHFFTEDERHGFKKMRKPPKNSQIWAAHFRGYALDLNGVDFTLTDPDGKLLVRAQVFTVLLGHLILQALFWRNEPHVADNGVRFNPNPGDWASRTIQIWPVSKKPVAWPPPKSMSTVADENHYANLRHRFKNSKGHYLFDQKAK